MVKFPLPNGSVVAVLEPGNLDRMRAGDPLSLAVNGATVRIHWSESLETLLKDGKMKHYPLPVVGGEVSLCYVNDMESFQRQLLPLMPISAEALAALIETNLKKPEVKR